MKKFNLTEVALRHKSIVYYFIFVIVVTGSYAYTQLGRMEDPDFDIRQMIITTSWPGADASEVALQVTDKIEKKLQETPHLDYLKSVSRPGISIIYVALKQDRPRSEVRPTWLEARNLVADISHELPQGVVGPFYNDRFDDVFGSIYALVSDGFSYEEMREQAELIRRRFLEIDSVKRVELIGVQNEKIYVEVKAARSAELGIEPTAIIEAIQNQNNMRPSGMIETDSDNVYLRLTGSLEDLDAIRSLPIRAAGRSFRLGDIASVTRDYIEPSTTVFSYEGKKSIALAISMQTGDNILDLGEELKRTVREIEVGLPLGLEIMQVSDQPKIVKESIDEFISSLREAVLIVMAISFISLGLRTGMVVAVCIPLVLAGVFLVMYIIGIDLHKVSLNALIISLGLLVDDEIIAVEMMAVKLESGLERFKAATAAYLVTAIPMLTGTLVTCAGFIPIGFSKGVAAEFAGALFPVISIALVLSWIISVTITPLIGWHIMKPSHKAVGTAPYSSRFYALFRGVLNSCLRNRKKVLVATILVFFLSLHLMTYVKQEFFPPSVRTEILVEMTLPEGSSMKSSLNEARRFADYLDTESGIANYSYYVGESAPRFVLTFEPVLPASNFVQFVVVADNVEERLKLQENINNRLATDFPNVRGNMKLIQTGPPSPYPVMLRVSGYEEHKVRDIAQKLAKIIRSEPEVTDVNYDWFEKTKTLRLAVDPDKLRVLGLDKQLLAAYLQTQLSGFKMAEFYEGDKTVDILLRLDESDRDQLSQLIDLPVYLSGGRFVPLDQIVSVMSFEAEEGAVWRRNLKPTITVGASISSGTGNDMTQRVYNAAEGLRRSLPFGYSIEIDGALEYSNNASQYMLRPVPWMILSIITILMFQLKRVSLMLLTLLTAPLGLIGVSIGMLLFDQPIGFLAQMGILALSGMIIRNSVILIDQIQKHLADGEHPWAAIVESAVFRFRPIMLTAAAAIMAMIPLMRSNFWGPMAVAISSGLLAATLLTLLVLPCMYAVAFKVKPQ